MKQSDHNDNDNFLLDHFAITLNSDFVFRYRERLYKAKFQYGNLFDFKHIKTV